MITGRHQRQVSPLRLKLLMLYLVTDHHLDSLTDLLLRTRLIILHKLHRAKANLIINIEVAVMLIGQVNVTFSEFPVTLSKWLHILFFDWVFLGIPVKISSWNVVDVRCWSFAFSHPQFWKSLCLLSSLNSHQWVGWVLISGVWLRWFYLPLPNLVQAPLMWPM